MRNVRGVLFADYVRMIRGRKDVDWSAHLDANDRKFLADKIDADAWYPMTAFERLGNAILATIAGGQMELVRAWGYHSVDALAVKEPDLVLPNDPTETLSRFRVLRASYFDFEALQIPMLHIDEARVTIAYQMGATAEEAASWQTLGFFDRLLELAGATDVSSGFAERSWAGDARTLIQLQWAPPL